MPTHRIFTMEWCGSTLIVAPQGDVTTVEDEEVRAELKDLLRIIAEQKVTAVVVDLSHAPYFGSTLLGALIKLWRRLSHVKGRMVLCGISDFVEDLLRVTRLESIWPVYPSRDEALAAIES